MKKIIGLEKGQRPALVVVECQYLMTNPAYIDPESPGLTDQVVARGIIPKINRLAAGFRAAKLPVIFCTIAARPNFEGFPVNCLLAYQVVRRGQLIQGSPAAALNDELVLGDHDIVINRIAGMAIFTGTDLDATLCGLSVETVVLAGVSTNIALPGSATEAVGLGYNVVLAEDCTAGGTAQTHQMQVSMHLPFLATVADSKSIVAAVGP
jgi:nicotinamidase-related amidase